MQTQQEVIILIILRSQSCIHYYKDLYVQKRLQKTTVKYFLIKFHNNYYYLFETWQYITSEFVLLGRFKTFIG